MKTDELITYVRSLGSLADGRFSDAEILNFANNEMLILMKDIVSVREDYLVESVDVPVSGIVNQNGIRIPPRALGGKVRDIAALGGTTPTEWVNIPRINLTELPSNPVGYYYKGNRILFNSVIGSLPIGGVMTLSYYARPGALVPTGSCAQITAVSGNVLTTVGADTTQWASTDLIKGTPGFESIYWNQGAAQFVDTVVTPGPPTTCSISVGAAQLGISGSFPEVGDWVAQSNTSPIPQIPQEFHQVLAQRTVVKCLESVGDDAGFQRAQAKAQEMQAAALDLIAERDDGRPEKLRIDVYSPWVYSNRWRWWR